MDKDLEPENTIHNFNYVIIIKGYQKYLVLGFTAIFDKLPKQVTNFMAQG